MTRISALIHRRGLAVAALALAACGTSDPGKTPDSGSGGTPKTPARPVRNLPPVARPLSGVDDPYAAAATVTLPPTAPIDSKALHNVFKLSPNVISGSEPDGPEGLNAIAALGVKTVVSVDGKAPNAPIAERYGLRYVHIPMAYKGISDIELMQLVKTFRELDGPFYVHCYHGKNRGPAAAAIARLTLDGASREQALAEMRQWCGTAPEYPGLYRDVANKPLPTDNQTDSYQFSFPSRRQTIGLRVVMLDAPRRHDALTRLLAHDWAADPDHPDLDAANEATKLAEDFASAVPLAEVKQKPQEFHDLLATAIDQSKKLQESISKARSGDAAALAESKQLFADLTQTCANCHSVYRDK